MRWDLTKYRFTVWHLFFIVITFIHIFKPEIGDVFLLIVGMGLYLSLTKAYRITVKMDVIFAYMYLLVSLGLLLMDRHKNADQAILWFYILVIVSVFREIKKCMSSED